MLAVPSAPAVLDIPSSSGSLLRIRISPNTQPPSNMVTYQGSSGFDLPQRWVWSHLWSNHGGGRIENGNVEILISSTDTKGSPVAGGTGRMYFDDIRLYP